MSRNIDKALKAIDAVFDVGEQHTSETAYRTDGYPETADSAQLCVRCDYYPATPTGWCENCHPSHEEERQRVETPSRRRLNVPLNPYARRYRQERFEFSILWADRRDG